MFAAGYVYRAGGVPTFVTRQAPLSVLSDGTRGLGTSQSDPRHGLIASSGGQCIGTVANCRYHTPTATNIGNVAIRFPGAGAAPLS